MTTPELFGCFAGFERHADGSPKLPPIGGGMGKALTPERLFKLRLMIGVGIHDRAELDRRWRQERARRDRLRAERGGDGRRRQAAGGRPGIAPPAAGG